MKNIFLLLLFLFTEVSAQMDCLTITSSDRNFSSIGQGLTEQEARIAATASLVSQISSFVTTRTDMTTSIENQVAQQNLVNLSTSISQLRLDGLKFEICRPNKKGEELITVVVYISKEDLGKSAAYVAEEVGAYMGMIKNKRAMEIDYISDAYHAYLNTFYSPFPIPYQDGTENISNLKTYLESYIREYLNSVELSCILVQEDLLHAQDQFILKMKLGNSADLNIKYELEIPALNAKTQFDHHGGDMAIIFQPVSTTEIFKGKLSIKTGQLPTKLAELDKIVNITREVEFHADFSSLIMLDFTLKENGEYYSFIPHFNNISVRNIEWLSDGQLISTEQSPKILKRELGNEVILRINRQDKLTVKKKINSGLNLGEVSLTLPIPEIPQRIITNQFFEDLEPSNPKPSVSHSFSKTNIDQIKDFQSLQPYLNDLKETGKAVYGKKSDFISPEKCWVVLVNPENSSIVHILKPFSSGRKDLKSGITFQDFESQLKGMAAIWVEFY